MSASPLPNLPRRRVSWFRRLRYALTRENLREFATTMGLVVPLTVLIWIWAEREQTLEREVTLSVDVRSRNPATVVQLVRGDRPDGGAANVSVKLSGPKANIDQLIDTLSRDTSRGRVVVDLAEDAGDGGTKDVALQPLLDQQNLFRDHGISVRAADPDTLRVRVDPLVTEEIRPSLPADWASRVESVVTDPPTVRVRGSRAALEQLKAADKLRVDLDLSNQPALRENEAGATVTLKGVAVRPPDAPGVTLEATSVASATLRLSQSREGELPSVVVNFLQPGGLKARVRIEPSTLQGIKIVGPPDVLRQLALAEGDKRPYAAVRITRSDLDTSGTRVPMLINLPPGVRAVEGSIPQVRFDVTSAEDGR